MAPASPALLFCPVIKSESLQRGEAIDAYKTALFAFPFPPHFEGGQQQDISISTVPVGSRSLSGFNSICKDSGGKERFCSDNQNPSKR